MNLLSLLFSLHGRIGRGQYWLGYLVLLALAVVSWLALFAGLGNESIPLLLVPIALLPFSLWIAICVMGKRYHDRGKSAWWILICLIPVVGGIWQFIELGLLRGDDGTNGYGPDPAFSFNVAGDIEALRRQAGHGAGNAVTAVARTAAPQPHAHYANSRPVFGKRV
ncbi:DUF805 domain-containing protein [Nordella sp. HKS 07]|uniref:DUF805 domain-containing protein n=1 Tax=Nordella sp. HKS 07 TaxID=2712222 RepID=UPI0013E0F655|nr:DUF805 domain-containing protein [Nordella sp. HKS 07]QIG49502.1 DUF805 domain-containing protein [Nordella sp. HKS 07]